MAIPNHRPVLAVPDLARSAAYDGDVLGFDVHVFAVRTVDGHRLMVGQRLTRR